MKLLTNSPTTRIIYVAVLSIAFFITYRHIYDAKIDFGGDNASYYILGKSIAKGEGYKNIDSILKPPHGHFPPGYPLLISPIIKLFPSSIDAVKTANGFFLLASIILFYFISLKLTGNIMLSFVASALYLLNAHFLKFSTIMMSEVSFQAITMLCILLFLYTDFDKNPFKNINFILVVFLGAFAFHIRSVGLCLVGALCLYFLFYKKWKYLLFISIGFVILNLPWKIRNNVAGIKSNSYVSQFIQKNPYRLEQGTLTLEEWIGRLGKNTERYLTREIPNGIFSFTGMDYKKATTNSEWIIGFIVLVMIIYGLVYFKNQQIFFIAYIICTFGILLNWPEIWTGPRFVFQLLPFFLLFILVGLIQVATSAAKSPKLKKTIPVAIPLIVLIVLFKFYNERIDHLHKTAEGTFTKKFNNYVELAKWTKKNLDRNAVVSARKPQIFHLYSDRFVCYYKRTPDNEELIEDFKRKKVTHVVFDQLGYSSGKLYLLPVIQKYPYKFKSIVKVGEPITHLFEFRPELGYEGEFNEENKKHGHGKFTFENGQVYEGEWVNNVREGKGILTLPTGFTIDGLWINDKLEGEALIKNKKGQLVEKALFKESQKISS